MEILVLIAIFIGAPLLGVYLIYLAMQDGGMIGFFFR